MTNNNNDPNALHVLRAAEEIIDQAATTRLSKIVRILGRHVAAAAYLTTGIPSARPETRE